jgi:hypothetical protein
MPEAKRQGLALKPLQREARGAPTCSLSSMPLNTSMSSTPMSSVRPWN